MSIRLSLSQKKGKMTYSFDSSKVPVFKTRKIDLAMWRDGIVVRAPDRLGEAVMSIPAMMQLKKKSLALQNVCHK